MSKSISVLITIVRKAELQRYIAVQQSEKKKGTFFLCIHKCSQFYITRKKKIRTAHGNFSLLIIILTVE